MRVAFALFLLELILLYLRGQWDVVGDTFIVGCKFPESIIYHETFAGNPDSRDAVYSTENGVYKRGCGLDNGERSVVILVNSVNSIIHFVVMISWGHDEV